MGTGVGGASLRGVWRRGAGGGDHSHQLGSWGYPEPGVLKIGIVPVFSGFMYAAVASYVCQSFRWLKLQLRNYPRYRFSVPQHSKEDTYISRFDYVVDSAAKHNLFWRGNLQNDHSGGVPQFPGDIPSSVGLNNSKGLSVGYNSTLKPNLISTFQAITPTAGDPYTLQAFAVVILGGLGRVSATVAAAAAIVVGLLGTLHLVFTDARGGPVAIHRFRTVASGRRDHYRRHYGAYSRSASSSRHLR